MKNEDRIVELLAESLIKQDQQTGLLGKIVDVLVRFGNGFNKITDILGTMSDTLISMDNRLGSMDGKLASMDQRLDSMDQKMGSMDNRMGSMDRHMELHHSLLEKIDGKLDFVQGHERRITRLEDKIFKKK
jgi:archaellum component FlaC